MITQQKLANGGRLGNQLFATASLIGIADTYGIELMLPEWEYSKYFQRDVPRGTVNVEQLMSEKYFHYDPHILFDAIPEKNIDLKGYLQSEKYFEHSIEKVADIFRFKNEFVIDCLSQFPQAFEKQTIALHIRRGDYVGNHAYVNLSPLYYISALDEHFPDWRSMNLIFFSDDINYCKLHFGCLENAFFSEGKSDIQDLCLMSKCKNFILSNSTFAWWAAWLSGTYGKVIRPKEYFAGGLKERTNDKDLWPERWIPWGGRQIDISDVAFMIPVTYDHDDRKKNISLSVSILQQNFKTGIIIGEQGGNYFDYMVNHSCVLMPFTLMPYFHRTKMLNEMAKIVTTPIIVNWDADVFVPPAQILEAVHKIRTGADMVYPYDGRFAHLTRNLWFDKLQRSLDIGIVTGFEFKGMEHNGRVSAGGAIFFNKASFEKGGKENERFISFGPEDSERRDRFTKLGFNVQRIKGVLYHMDHFKGPNSLKIHQHFKANREEYKKVAAMSKEELENYIQTWV